MGRGVAVSLLVATKKKRKISAEATSGSVTVDSSHEVLIGRSTASKVRLGHTEATTLTVAGQVLNVTQLQHQCSSGCQQQQQNSTMCTQCNSGYQLVQQNTTMYSTPCKHSVGEVVVTTVDPGSDYVLANGTVRSKVRFPKLAEAVGSLPQREWVLREPAIPGDKWSDITWSEELGLFVAVGGTTSNSGIMYSSDGVAWFSVYPPVIKAWRSVVWAKELSLFVILGFDSAATSPDGKSWTEQSIPTSGTWYGLAWSPSLTLLVTVRTTVSGQQAMTSPDGINWTLRTTPSVGGTAFLWSDVAWSPQLSLFAAVALEEAGVMTSPDGITWTLRTASSNNAWSEIVWAAGLGKFVAVAYSNFDGDRQVMTSSNGISWTSHAVPQISDWVSILWSEERGLLVSLSYRNITGKRAMFSTDGANWTLMSTPLDNSWASMAYSPSLDLFAAVATDGDGRRVMTNKFITYNSTTSFLLPDLQASNPFSPAKVYLRATECAAPTGSFFFLPSPFSLSLVCAEKMLGPRVPTTDISTLTANVTSTAQSLTSVQDTVAKHTQRITTLEAAPHGFRASSSQPALPNPGQQYNLLQLDPSLNTTEPTGAVFQVDVDVVSHGLKYCGTRVVLQGKQGTQPTVFLETERSPDDSSRINRAALRVIEVSPSQPTASWTWDLFGQHTYNTTGCYVQNEYAGYDPVATVKLMGFLF